MVGGALRQRMPALSRTDGVSEVAATRNDYKAVRADGRKSAYQLLRRRRLKQAASDLEDDRIHAHAFRQPTLLSALLADTATSVYDAGRPTHFALPAWITQRCCKLPYTAPSSFSSSRSLQLALIVVSARAAGNLAVRWGNASAVGEIMVGLQHGLSA